MSQPGEGRSLWQSARSGAGLAALAVLLLFVALNFDRVDVEFLIADVSLPLAFALILAAGLGFLIGMATHRQR